MNPFTLLLISIAGWLNRNQQDVIEYLQGEIRALKEPSGKPPRFNDGQRRHLALEGKRIGRYALNPFGSLVTPHTLLAWDRRLLAQKYDSSRTRKPGRPPAAEPIGELILKLARENRSCDYAHIQGALVSPP